MFPSQLMMIRKSKSGTARSILLDETSSDYAQSVMELLEESIGLTYGEIEDKIRDLELRSQNPKVVRGIFTVLCRLANFSFYAKVQPQELRKRIFTDTQTPAVSPETRMEIIQRISDEFEISTEDVERTLYGDLESERILENLPHIENSQIVKRFNLEQVESALMKALKLDLKMRGDNGKIIRFIGRIGLLTTITREGDIVHLNISGPISPTGKTERYGPIFSLLLRKILTVEWWEAEADLELGKKGEKSIFRYYIDSSIKELLYVPGDSVEDLPPFVSEDDGTLIDGKIYFADYRINISGKEYLIIVSRLINLEENRSLARLLKDSGKMPYIFVLLRGSEKCPSREKCFKNNIDWYSVKEFLERKNETDAMKSENRKKENDMTVTKKEIGDEVKKHLEQLYPDSMSMVDYLEFMGFDPASVLTEIGYRIRWRGLRIEVTGKEE